MNKAIFTLCTKFDVKRLAMTGGFLDGEAYACSIILSIMLAKENIGHVELYTDTIGASLVKSLDLPVDKYHIVYDDFDYPHPLWVVSKLITFSLQQEPFIHLDLDAYLWKPLPERMAGAAVVGQSNEENWGSYERGLKHLMENIKWVPDFIRTHWNNRHDKIYAMCAGAYGGADIETIQFVSKAAIETINHPENKAMFNELLENMTDMDSVFWCYPILMEQYFMGVYCHQKNIDLHYVLSEEEAPYFTHLMAESKRDAENTFYLKRKVLTRYPDKFEKIWDSEFWGGFPKEGVTSHNHSFGYSHNHPYHIKTS